jgi:hypothetical protein
MTATILVNSTCADCGSDFSYQASEWGEEVFGPRIYCDTCKDKYADPCPNCGQPAGSGDHEADNLRDCPRWVPGAGWAPTPTNWGTPSEDDLTAGTTGVRINLLSCGHVVWIARPDHGGINHCLSCNRAATVEHYIDGLATDADPWATWQPDPPKAR